MGDAHRALSHPPQAGLSSLECTEHGCAEGGRGENLTLSPCTREDLIPASSCMALRQPQSPREAGSPGTELEPRMGGEHESPTGNLWF